MSKIVVQICCSVDSHYFLECLRQDFPNDEIIGFFYNPNIHPYTEYMLRLKDVEFSCKKLGITLLDGLYDINKWYEITKGYENEPEKGNRCTICFDDRLDVTVLKAKELGADKFTTTLLMSPLKSQEKLKIIGDNLATKNALEFIYKDYRSGSGGVNQSLAVKNNRLYRQNYCGCMYALNAQREAQNRLCDELITPISQQVLPNSIEYRLALFEQRDKLADEGKEFFIKKVDFINYRLLNGLLKINKNIVPSYIVAYSYLKSQKTNAKVEFIKEGMAYLSKNGIILLDINRFNDLTNSSYKSVKELLCNPLSFDDEVNLRKSILKDFSLSPILVVDSIKQDDFVELVLNSTYFSDTKEEIEIIS